MQMRDCPKFQICSAPICPLDADWRERTLIGDDPTCFYLTESVKDGGAGNFSERGLDELYQVIVTLTPEITARHARIFRALERSKLTGSRMNRKFGGDSYDH